MDNGMAIGKGTGPDTCAGPDTSVGSEAGKGADPDMRNGANANARLAARDDALGKGTGADPRLAASDEPLVRVPIAYRDPPERPILRDMGGWLTG